MLCVCVCAVSVHVRSFGIRALDYLPHESAHPDTIITQNIPLGLAIVCIVCLYLSMLLYWKQKTVAE